MMSVLLMRLAGPMQSWGTQSRFAMRDTGLEPSKSGVVGLLCAALGRARHETVEDLAGLRMAVRVDREGILASDYQTAGGEHRTGSVLGHDEKGRAIPYGVRKADGSAPDTVVSWRHYLADADFLVGLAGEDRDLLACLHAALTRPVWPLALGRKSYVPAVPPYLPDGLRHQQDLLTTLSTWPWKRPPRDRPKRLRLVVDTDDPAEGVARQDVPLSFSGRRFSVRHVCTKWLNTDDLPQPDPEAATCI